MASPVNVSSDRHAPHLPPAGPGGHLFTGGPSSALEQCARPIIGSRRSADRRDGLRDEDRGEIPPRELRLLEQEQTGHRIVRGQGRGLYALFTVQATEIVRRYAYPCITMNRLLHVGLVAVAFSWVSPTLAQEGWEEHLIDAFYTKIELTAGTLDENGSGISFVFVPTEIKTGVYEVEVTDGPGDLYEIKGTDYFCRFAYHYGYAGYGDEGVLKVERGYQSSAFFTKD